MSERAYPTSSGLFDSASRLLSSLLAVAQTRLELISVDLSEAHQRLLALALLTITALFALLIGALLATLVLVLAYWDSHRLLVMSVLSLGYLAIGSTVAVFAVRQARGLPRIFASSIAELSKDRQHLQPQQ